MWLPRCKQRGVLAINEPVVDDLQLANVLFSVVVSDVGEFQTHSRYDLVVVDKGL